MVALLERETSGQGQWVQSSLLAAQISMLDFQAARWLVDHEVPPQAGNNHPTTIPTGVYPTSDGHINIATAGGEIYERLCRTLGDEELITHPDYATGKARSDNRDALNARLDVLTRQKTSAEWVDILNKAGVPCGPIYDIDEMFDDPQVKHLGMAASVNHPDLGPIEIVKQAASLSRTPFRIHSATPELGQHTDEILGGLGIDANEITSLKERGIV
jgi:formyl-CoA transferase